MMGEWKGPSKNIVQRTMTYPGFGDVDDAGRLLLLEVLDEAPVQCVDLLGLVALVGRGGDRTGQ